MRDAYAYYIHAHHVSQKDLMREYTLETKVTNLYIVKWEL